MNDFTVIHSFIDTNSPNRQLVVQVSYVQVLPRENLFEVIAAAGIKNINCVFEGRLAPEVYP